MGAAAGAGALPAAAARYRAGTSPLDQPKKNVRLPLGPAPRGASLAAAGGRRGRKRAQDDGGPDRKPAQNGGGIGTAQDGPRSRVRGSSSFLRRRFIRSQKNTNPQLFLKPKIPRWGPGKRCETIKKPRAIKTKTGAGSEAGRKRAWGPQGAPGPLAGHPPLFCSSRAFCFFSRVFFYCLYRQSLRLNFRYVLNLYAAFFL